MKIGLVSYALRWAFKSGMSLEDFLRRASDDGAEAVQLCENSGIDSLSAKECRDLARLAGQLDLSLEYGSLGGDIALLQKSIKRIADLEGRIFRCVIDSDGLSPATVTSNIKSVLPMLKANGIVLCAENHIRFSPLDLCNIVREINDPAVGICLDPINSIGRWIGPEQAIQELIPLARTAHIKDARIARSGTGWAITGTALGEGDINLKSYLATVMPRVESLLIESWMDPLDGETGPLTLAQETEWVKKGLSFLKSHRNKSDKQQRFSDDLNCPI